MFIILYNIVFNLLNILFIYSDFDKFMKITLNTVKTINIGSNCIEI